MRKVFGFLVTLAMVLTPLALTGQRGSTAWAQTADPPGRVGRLNYINGPVSLAPGGLNQWAQATLNYPLTTGTALWTDQRGRAELHIGSTVIRMDEYTELDILDLDDQTAQLRVAQGTVDIGVPQLDAGERFEVATPTASIALVRPGHYRFEADDSGVRVTVWTGQADVATAAYSFSVSPGQTVLISDRAYQLVATPALSEFDRWSLARHAEEERALRALSPYVPPAMTGYEDLGRYGTWHHMDAYGIVWFPAVGPGWAPYRDGRWVWISPWGWTWVDNAPWGFAPFHYGRWVLIGGVWAWIPGPVVVRPIFAPALVVFIVIGDAIGWFPLAPHEVFVPWYPVSPVYRRNINITIINVNITNINITNANYIYRHSPHAITIVRRDAFVQAHPVVRSLIAVPRTELDRGRLTAGAPIQPRVESLLGRPQDGAGSHRPPAVVERRPVLVRRDPPAPRRPDVSAPGAQLRMVPVKRAVEQRDSGPAPQPGPQQTPAPLEQSAPAPRPGNPAPEPRPQVAPPAPQQPNAVPTPHRRRQDTPPPQSQPNAPAQPNGPASRPNVPQPNVPQPTPAAPQPIAPAPHPGNIGPQPRPQPVQPIFEPNPVPTPHPRRPGASPQPPRPNLPPAQPPEPNAPVQPNPPAQPNSPAPRQQPGLQPPRPIIVPTPPAPASPHVPPAPQPPRNQIRQPNCDPHTLNYDPRACAQNRPRGH